MGRITTLASLIVIGLAGAAIAAPRAAILAVDLGGGAPEFVRAKASARVQEGLRAAGYEVTDAKLSADLASCRSGSCLAKVAKALDVSSLVVVTVTRKDDSTIIVMKLMDPQSGEASAEVHEVCDLCGQSELEDRIGVAASALRAKAEAAKSGRIVAAPPPPAAGAVPRVAVIPGIAVNLDAAKVDALSQDLAEAITSQLVVDAVGGLEVRRQLPSEGLPADCVSNAACTNDVARRTGASQLLFVVMVGGAGGSVQIDTTWIEPSSARHVSRPAVDLTSSTDDAARGKFESIAHTLLPDAQVRPKPLPPPGKLQIDTRMTEATPMHFTTPALVTGGAAVVGLAAGTFFALETRSKYNTCQATPATCPQPNRDSIRNWALAADVSFGIALGAAIATGAFYATSGEGPHVIVSPTAEGGAAASWIGRF